MKNKKLILAGLIMLICACMTGCGGCGKNKAIVEVDKDAIYREEEIKMDFPKGFEAERMLYENGKIYFSGYSYDEYTYNTFWGSANIDGSDLTLTKMTDKDGNPLYFDRMVVTSEGNVGLMYYEYIPPEDPEDEFAYGSNKPMMSLYSSDGKTLKNVDLSEYIGENEWIQSTESINGKVVLVVNNCLLYFDSSLNFEKEVKSDEDLYFDSLLQLKDGSFAIAKWEENGEKLYRFDTQSFKVGPEIEVPFSLYNYRLMSGGKSGYDLLLLDNNNIYGFNIGNTEPKTVINFIDSDIYAGNFNMFEATGVNEFISSSGEWNKDEYKIRICKYTKVDPEDVIDKQTITLGCLYMWDNLKREVITFNREHQDIRITVIDYSSFDTEEDWQGGTKKFNSDIVSGKGPDIIVAQSNSDLMNYFGKGLFADLNKYLDKDEEIDKEDFFPNIIDLCSEKGKLYCLSPVFYVETVLAKRSLLNGKTSWTIRDMIEFEKNMPEDSVLFEYSTRSTILSQILSSSGNSFIDEKNGKCNFNSDEFIALLEYIKDMPEEFDYYYEDGPIMYSKAIAEDDYATKWRKNRVILMQTSISDMRSFNYNQQGSFGETVDFIGYPTSEGNGSTVYFSNIFAISSKSSNPDAAWEFLRTRFTKEAMEDIGYGIPLSMSRFDEMAEEATKRPYYLDENGEKVEYDEEYWIGEETIKLPPISKEEVERVKKFIMSVDRIQTYHEDIIPIIEEEAAYFFEGQKTAEDVANIIQSRLTIYINEKQ